MYLKSDEAKDKIHFLQWPKIYFYVEKNILICPAGICNKLGFVFKYNDCDRSPMFQVQIYLQPNGTSWRRKEIRQELKEILNFLGFFAA
jgi:hypothetical protein